MANPAGDSLPSNGVRGQQESTGGRGNAAQQFSGSEEQRVL